MSLILSSKTSVWMFSEINKSIVHFYFVLRIYEEYIGNISTYRTYKDGYCRTVQCFHNSFPIQNPVALCPCFWPMFLKLRRISSVWLSIIWIVLFHQFLSVLFHKVMKCQNFVYNLLFCIQWPSRKFTRVSTTLGYLRIWLGDDWLKQKNSHTIN